MTVAAVATVAPSAQYGGFLRVSANCRDSRATVAATLRKLIENVCNRLKKADFPNHAQKSQNSASFQPFPTEKPHSRIYPRIGVPGGRGFPPYRGNPLTRIYRLGGAGR